MEVLDADTRRRRDQMRARVKADLARRGIGSADLEGLARDTRFEAGGGAEAVVLGWTMTVQLRGRRALVYELDNAEGAVLLCDGVPVPDFKPED